MKKYVIGMLLSLAAVAHAESNVVGMPASTATSDSERSAYETRLVPHVGFNGFSLPENRGNSSIGRNFGLWVDVGQRELTFETGLSLIQASAGGLDNGNRGPSPAVEVQAVGIPLLAKYNLSGNAASSVYVKGGAIIIPAMNGSDVTKNFPIVDAWAHVGLGGALPVTPTASLILEGSYNKPFGPSSTSIRQYGMEGYTLLVGTSLSL